MMASLDFSSAMLTPCFFQLEEFLNRSSPFSIWINGQNMETLERQDEQQEEHFQDLERRYTGVADEVDGIFEDSMKVLDYMRSMHQPFSFNPFHRISRFQRSVFQKPQFHSIFQPMMQMSQGLFGSFGSFMNGDADFPSQGRSELVILVMKY